MQTMLMIVLVLILVGCFMETLSMLLTTAPLITPIVIALGFDPVWFGILLMVLLETALNTDRYQPVCGSRGAPTQRDDRCDERGPPFVAKMFIMLALLLWAPGLALWLPSLFY